MTNVDQFESLFRSASREVFCHEPIRLNTVLIITDLEGSQAKDFSDKVRRFLRLDNTDKDMKWRVVSGGEFQTVGELLSLVESVTPDLICTYRNLHSSAWQWPYSLGAHIDLLTQHTTVPVMLLPHPKANHASTHAFENTDTVMAIADHLTGDHRLVNYALRFVSPDGQVWLTHIEDESTFDRYIEAISKIPTLDTDDARATLREQLLKQPRDYIESCVNMVSTAGVPVSIESVVMFGHHLSEYQRLIQAHEIDLLILNTKDDNQQAMHGMAYALAVELRHTPLLML